MAGIIITVFTTHFVRSASTNKANNIRLSIKHIQTQLVRKVAAHFGSTINSQY